SSFRGLLKQTLELHAQTGLDATAGARQGSNQMKNAIHIVRELYANRETTQATIMQWSRAPAPPPSLCRTRHQPNQARSAPLARVVDARRQHERVQPASDCSTPVSLAPYHPTAQTV